MQELAAQGTKMLRNFEQEIIGISPQYKLQIEEIFDSAEHPLYTLPEEIAPIQEQEYGEEDEEEEEDDDAEYFKPGEKRRRVRPRKLPGEEANRFTNSSKRARFNQTQQLNPSSLSALKGANLLHLALHQTQEMQSST